MTDAQIGRGHLFNRKASPMKVNHIFNLLDGTTATEALYTHNGRPMCARFAGKLMRGEVMLILAELRKEALK